MGAFFGVLGADKFGSWAPALLVAMLAGAASRSCTRSSRSIFAPTRSSAARRSTSSRSGSPGTCSSRSTAIRARRVPTSRHPAQLPRQSPGSRTSRSAARHRRICNLHDLGRASSSYRSRYVVLFRTWIGLRHPVGGRASQGRRHGGDLRLRSALRRSHTVRRARRPRRRVPVGRSRASFNENLTGGRGFIALAAVIFGHWRPFGAFARVPDVRLLGRARDSAAGTYCDQGVRRRSFRALPYVLTVVVVAGVVGTLDAPRRRWPSRTSSSSVDRAAGRAARVGLGAHGPRLGRDAPARRLPDALQRHATISSMRALRFPSPRGWPSSRSRSRGARVFAPPCRSPSAPGGWPASDACSA